MQREIKIVDEVNKIYRITLPDERFYGFEGKDEVTGLPKYEFIPSVTWIVGSYPKGVQYFKWLASKGWDEAEAIKKERSEQGSKVHQAIELLIQGGTVNAADLFINPSNGMPEELSASEYQAICSFNDWVVDTNPTFIMNESLVRSIKYNYAGTVDCVAKIGDVIWIIDFKTGQNIWPSYQLQLSGYKQALKEGGRKVEGARLAILQVGYEKNKKKKYKFTEVEDNFDLFLATQKIWINDHGSEYVKQIDLPISVTLPTSIKSNKSKKSK